MSPGNAMLVKEQKTNSLKRPFLAFQIQITSRCNLRCPICPKNAFGSEWKDGDMDMATYEAISDAFPLVKQVYLDAWGEPLLNPNFWEMAALARSAGCSVGTTTNGVLLEPRIAEQLARQMDVVGISMDGATPETYESIRVGAKFEAVVEGVRALIAARKARRPDGLPLVSLLFLKNKRNIKEIPEMVDLAGQLGVDEVIASNITYLPTPGHDRLKVFSLQCRSLEYEAILDQARQRAKAWDLALRIYPLTPKRVPFCEANPLQELHITWEGGVSPCVYLTLPTFRDFITKVYEGQTFHVPQTCFGNLRVSNLLDIWNTGAYQQFRQPFAKRLATCGNVNLGITRDGEFQEMAAETFELLSQYPLPDVCRYCYKAMGL